MASMLSANNPIAKDIFSAFPSYGRNIYNTSFTPDSNITNATFPHSIWQTSQHDLLPIRTQMTRNEHAYQNQRDLPSLTSRAKGTLHSTNSASGKQSPITFQNTSSSSTEPLSAISRSNNGSAVLTPSSNISIADQFSAQLNTKHDLTQPRMTRSHSDHAQAHAWPNAKEFRPKLTLISDPLPISDDIPKLSSTEVTPFSGSRNRTFNTFWTQQDLGTGYNGLSVRNDFRPVLPAAEQVYNSTKYSSQARSNGYGATRSVYNDNKPFYGTIDESYRPHYSQPNVQKYNLSAKTHLRSMVASERNIHPNCAIPYTHANHPDQQTRNYRSYQVPHDQGMISAQSYNGESHPEDYYRNTVDQYPFRPTSARADPTGMQSFQRYNHYYPEETVEFGVQMFPPTSFQYSTDAQQENHNNYYVAPNVEAQYINADSVQERSPDTQQIYRSPLLEEFRTNKSSKYELKDIYDHVVEFSGDQHGSRFIQQKLEVANSDEKDRVFNEVARDSRQLMTDIFGNYVIQKMFEHGNQSQKKLLANHMKGHVYALSLQTYGCRVVQKAFDHILTDQQAALIKELEGNVLKVVENMNGNHVIQKAIEMIPGEHIQFIVDAHKGHVHHLSKHPYGCRVIQRILEYCQPHAKRQILDELHGNISELIQDAFGNYVVQHVIVNGEPQDRKAVIDKVQSKLLENAMHKFASNVVEKALDHADEHQRRTILQKLTGRDENGQSTITKLLSHQYGNYVIQKTTFHLSGQALASTIAEMDAYLHQLQRVSAGKQVAALQKSILEAQDRLNGERYSANSIYMDHPPTHPRTGFGRR